jgi:hypothetical protein
MRNDSLYAACARSDSMQVVPYQLMCAKARFGNNQDHLDNVAGIHYGEK